ncbi:peptide-binding protein [Wenjunlia vitaminophila]|uniref:Peptide-binding protein n=1 Tax=Wenjunlia vitaminophila TaxID=76728 RepID=A0A0T6LVW4_WENVI|nr:ABC transporter substrate-binding protein [Wenjunlia vitaminophila]KRV50251.1 peptide-binding protein [Wenjunlia vitaminophila]
MKRAKLLALPAAASMFVPLLAGCGGGSDDEGDDTPVIMGSTDSVSTLDPAGAYDIGSWTVMTNTFQALMRVPNDASEPQPEAAERCGFTSRASTAYRCTLRSGLKFSNGHALTAKDVAFSVQRTVKINDDFGPASLFGNLDRVEALGDRTVVFHLKQPDATFPYVLATPAAAIVDQEVYPADKLLTQDQIAGSGPYALQSIRRSSDKRKRAVQAEFVRNENYQGGIEMKNSRFVVRWFDDSIKMQVALEKAEIDLIHRTLTPKQLVGLEQMEDRGIKVIEAPGTETRYLAFNTDDDSVKDVAVRRAMAQVLDRQALVRDVYQRTAEPLYSMIPKGITGHVNAFYNKYTEPNPKKARKLLKDADISTPVKLTFWYTSDHYGAATAEEFAELKEQFEADGLFEVELKSRTWEDFQKGYLKREYEVFGMGWFPDFPDPDNFISPFMLKDNFLRLPYEDEYVQETLIPKTRKQDQRSTVVDEFTEVQDIIAEDVPLLPLWQGKQYVAYRDGINGVQWTLDSSSTFRFWVLEKGDG